MQKQIFHFYQKCFWQIFIITSIVFSFYLITFFFGNHDFLYLKFGTKVFQGLEEGRLTQFIPQKLLFDNQILPILSASLGLLFFCLTPIILTKAWHIKQKTTIIIFSLLLTLNPQILSQAYYVHQITSILLWHLFIALGLYILLLPTRTYQNYILTHILWTISICGYAPTITTILVITTSSIIIDILQNNLTLKQIIQKYLPIYLIALLSATTYFAILKTLKFNNLFENSMYNTQVLSIKDIIFKIAQNYKLPFKVLFFQTPYEVPFAKFFILILLLLCIALAYIQKRIAIISPLLIITILSAGIPSFISPHNTFYFFRINFFSIPYIIAILFIITHTSKNLIIKNFSLICSVIILFNFIKADFITQKIWHLGNKQDELATERLRTNLFPQIDLRKKYRLYYIGEHNGRKKFANQSNYRSYKDIYREYYDYEYLICPFFTSGLFLTENHNPIYGSMLYYIAPQFTHLITNNEYLNNKEKELYEPFAFTLPKTSQMKEIYNWLTSSNRSKTLVFDEDIFIYISPNYTHYLSIMYYLEFIKQN